MMVEHEHDCWARLCCFGDLCFCTACCLFFLNQNSCSTPVANQRRASVQKTQMPAAAWCPEPPGVSPGAPPMSRGRPPCPRGWYTRVGCLGASRCAGCPQIPLGSRAFQGSPNVPWGKCAGSSLQRRRGSLQVQPQGLGGCIAVELPLFKEEGARRS